MLESSPTGDTLEILMVKRKLRARDRKQREMVVLLLRQFAERTARENRENLSRVHPKLRTINALARELLAVSR